jgi:hypothetical protein
VNGGKHISLDVFALLPMIETTWDEIYIYGLRW